MLHGQRVPFRLSKPTLPRQYPCCWGAATIATSEQLRGSFHNGRTDVLLQREVWCSIYGC